MTRRSMLLLLGGALPRRMWTAGIAPELAALRAKQGLIVHSPRPLDLETPPAMLDSWITPLSRFFVRSHFYIPQVDMSRWQLSIDGLVEKPHQLRLEQLRRLPQIERVVTIECAGNGRAYFQPHVAGAQWRKGSVGTARWKGVRLRDVLARAVLKPQARHIIFDGADTGMAAAPDFVRSVPVEKCLHPDTLLATHMNGAPVPVEHGFPLRLITPGWEGAASIKWLTRITASASEASGFFMQTAYRYPIHPVAPGAAVDAKDMAPITSLAVKSLITRAAGPVAGFAWAGQDEIARVEISTDAGRTWKEAKLGPEKAPFAWRAFQYHGSPAGSGAKILSRATDSRGRMQPASPAWNPMGYLNNAIDSVPRNEPSKAPGLPPGEGRRIVLERCVACHDEQLILEQHLDAGRWTREVEKMMRWGSPVSEKEKELLVRYLAESFR
jgi:sulfite oxidase